MIEHSRRSDCDDTVRASERAFTLIEILVVMIIISILMAVAIPTFLAQKSTAQRTQVLTNIQMVKKAIEACAVQSETGSYGSCVEHQPLWAFEASLRNLKQCCSDGPPAPGKYDINGVTGLDTRVLVPDDSMHVTGFEVYTYIEDGDRMIWFQLVHWPDGGITRRCGEGLGMPPWSRNNLGGVPGSRMCTTGKW